MINRISATNDSIAAGRDVSINVSNVSIEIISDAGALLSEIERQLSIEPGQISRLLGVDNQATSQELLQKLPIFQQMGALVRQAQLPESLLVSDISAENLGLNQLEQNALLQQTSVFLARYDFAGAYSSLSSLVKVMPRENPRYVEVRKTQLISGLIEFGCRNDIMELQKLFAEIDADEHLLEKDSEIACAAADILSEICTRQPNTEGLRSACRLLVDGYSESTGIRRAHIANSLGLAYRRIGERDEPKTLAKAVVVLSEGLSSAEPNSFLYADISNNLAIAKIREFESFGNSESLEQARSLLSVAIDALSNVADPRVFLLKPKLLNNLGNTYKQEALANNCVISAKRAIQSYGRAEVIWTSDTAPYEWAMLQKNKGETMVVLGRMTLDKSVLERALAFADTSTKFRTIKNSPQQWASSVCVVACAYRELAKLRGGMGSMPVKFSRMVGKYVGAYDKNSHRWSSIPTAPIHEAVAYLREAHASSERKI